MKEVQLLKDLQANMQTLNQLVTYLTNEKQNSDDAIREILRANHPIFEQVRKVLNVPYRVFFTTRTEFSQWAKATRNFTTVDSEYWDSPEFEEWIWNNPVTTKPSRLLKISTKVFDEKGDLVIYTAQQWHSDWVTLSEYVPARNPPNPTDDILITDDDVPF